MTTESPTTESPTVPLTIRRRPWNEQLRHWSDQIMAVADELVDEHHPKATVLLAASLGLTMIAEDLAPSPDRPIYAKTAQEPPENPDGTQLWIVTVDEGWRQQILAADLYEWVADFLIRSLQGRPFDRRSKS